MMMADNITAEETSRHSRGRRRQQQQQQQYARFAHAKQQCFQKRDKSSAGGIDEHAVEICNVVNARREFYTTSSCSGRCFLYTGRGIKSTQDFHRFRVNHDFIDNAEEYFDLSTLPIPANTTTTTATTDDENCAVGGGRCRGGDVWLRFEPFILHVACRSMADASSLMTAARPAFKNVGLTSWKSPPSTTPYNYNTTPSSSSSSQQQQQSSSSNEKYIVAIWGDEGLDMPLSMPHGQPLIIKGGEDGASTPSLSHWLKELVNERHERNWKKMNRFVQAVRDMPDLVDDDDETRDDNGHEEELDNDGYWVVDRTNDKNNNAVRIPRSYDVIGDVALLHTLPPPPPPPHVTTDNEESSSQQTTKYEDERRKEIGMAIMRRNKAIRVVALREQSLGGTERAPGSLGLTILANARSSTSKDDDDDGACTSLIATHCEHGIKCVVDLQHCFFSPRMGAERLRISGLVQPGEDVLVLFAGVGLEALHIAGRTEAASVLAVEDNAAAVACARRGHELLRRNRSVKPSPVEAAQRLEIVQGDVLQVLPTLTRQYQRILAGRPKDGYADGDLGDSQSAETFLRILLPALCPNGGTCHWYDFAADHEFPSCERSKELIRRICAEQGLGVEIINVFNAGSVAMRQLRVCIDFRLVPANGKV